MLEHFTTIVGLHHFITLLLKQNSRKSSDRLIIVNHQNTSFMPTLLQGDHVTIHR
ncbi:Uncharacterised protein [Vibrio cholerae]|nr:Uncharacterised protein [Vibrio cholerae]CSI77107.1 Uncharacterised protein [Vibrio cholerae]